MGKRRGLAEGKAPQVFEFGLNRFVVIEPFHLSPQQAVLPNPDEVLKGLDLINQISDDFTGGEAGNLKVPSVGDQSAGTLEAVHAILISFFFYLLQLGD